MPAFGSERIKDEVILAARLLLVVLFLISGAMKITNYSMTIGIMVQTGVPMPSIAALVAIVVELFFSIAIVLGVLTRPLAILMMLYTLAAAFLGHAYWSMTGDAMVANAINFYKNLSICGGFLLLYVTGPGRYSIDAKLKSSSPANVQFT